METPDTHPEVPHPTDGGAADDAKDAVAFRDAIAALREVAWELGLLKRADAPIATDLTPPASPSVASPRVAAESAEIPLEDARGSLVDENEAHAVVEEIREAGDVARGGDIADAATGGDGSGVDELAFSSTGEEAAVVVDEEAEGRLRTEAGLKAALAEAMVRWASALGGLRAEDFGPWVAPWSFESVSTLRAAMAQTAGRSRWHARRALLLSAALGLSDFLSTLRRSLKAAGGAVEDGDLRVGAVTPRGLAKLGVSTGKLLVGEITPVALPVGPANPWLLGPRAPSRAWWQALLSEAGADPRQRALVQQVLDGRYGPRPA